jgi:acyl carrier protein
MDHLQLVLMGGALLISATGVFLYERVNRRRAQRLLQGRPPLDPQAFGRAHFGESPRRAMLAAQVREVLAEHVPYALDGLGPDDAFVQDLRMDALDSMSTVEFTLGLEARLGVKIADADAERIRTFRQLLDYLDEHVPREGVGPASKDAVEQVDAADEVRDDQERRGPRS